MNVHTLPFVEAHETEQTQKMIDDFFVKETGKKLNFRPAGYMIAVKIWIRPEEIKVIKDKSGKDKTLWMPPVTLENDKFSSVAALVCAIGPQAYKGENSDGSARYPEGPWCRIGDWVAIPRQSCFLFEYRGIPMGLLPDDKIIGVVDEPADITPIRVSPKV